MPLGGRTVVCDSNGRGRVARDVAGLGVWLRLTNGIHTGEKRRGRGWFGPHLAATIGDEEDLEGMAANDAGGDGDPGYFFVSLAKRF